jgi:hypothetical protein
MTEEEKQEIIDAVVEELKDYIEKHLRVEVDGYYEPYSGQTEHYHKTRIYFSEFEY